MSATAAAAAAPIASETSEQLRRAADDEAALCAAVIAVIARRPASVEAIVAEAAALAPQSRPAIAACAASAFPGFAQRIKAAASGATAARTEPAPAPSAWTGGISIGGARTSGNTTSGEASAGLKAEYDGASWEHHFELAFDYGSEDDSTTKQRLLSNFESLHDLNERLYAFGFLEYEDDRFSGFEFETTEGAGLGYRIALAPPLQWRVQAGPGLRQARIDATDETENEVIGLLRSELEWAFSETGKLANETTVTVGAERTVARNVASVTMQLIGKVAGRLSLDVQYNSAPPPHAEATDTTTKVSLVYAF